MDRPAAIARSAITLGILAGGGAVRLGGRDKAWLIRDGVPQVLRIAARFADETAGVLVSANAQSERYGEAGLAVVRDRSTGAGPMSGLDALGAACRTPWLLTLPVDIVDYGDDLLRSLVAGHKADGARARDEDGPQPLVALWRVAALREATSAALAAGEFAVHALQARLDMAEVHLDGVRFGNLNTPADLRAAGIAGL